MALAGGTSEHAGAPLSTKVGEVHMGHHQAAGSTARYGTSDRISSAQLHEGYGKFPHPASSCTPSQFKTLVVRGPLVPVPASHCGMFHARCIVQNMAPKATQAAEMIQLYLLRYGRPCTVLSTSLRLDLATKRTVHSPPSQSTAPTSSALLKLPSADVNRLAVIPGALALSMNPRTKAKLHGTHNMPNNGGGKREHRHSVAFGTTTDSDKEDGTINGVAEMEGGKGGETEADRTTTLCHATRQAAVATAVEERSKIQRFSGGLEGGAGTDGVNFEYLDHTADVQLHSWGDTVERAMENALAAMFNVITDINTIDVDTSLAKEVEVTGHDAISLLFALMNEFLFMFHAECFAVRKATVGAINKEAWSVKASAEGEIFDLSKHPQGTEVKAVTYSNMQINDDPITGKTDIYVILDI